MKTLKKYNMELKSEENAFFFLKKGNVASIIQILN